MEVSNQIEEIVKISKGEGMFLVIDKINALIDTVNSIPVVDLTSLETRLELLAEEVKKKPTFELSPEAKLELKGDKGDEGKQGRAGNSIKGPKGDNGNDGKDATLPELDLLVDKAVKRILPEVMAQIPTLDKVVAELRQSSTITYHTIKGDKGEPGEAPVIDYDKILYMLIDKVREQLLLECILAKK